MITERIAGGGRTLLLVSGLWLGLGGLGLANSAAGSPRSGVLVAQTSAVEYRIRGYLKADRGDHLAAIADYTQAIFLAPDDAETYYYRGISRAFLSDFMGAIQDYDQAIQLRPGYVEAHNSRGVAYFYLGNLESAASDYSQTIAIYEMRALVEVLLQGMPRVRLNPDLAYAYYNRAGIVSHLGNKAAAVEDFQAAADIFLQTQQLVEYQNALLRLRELGQPGVVQP